MNDLLINCNRVILKLFNYLIIWKVRKMFILN